MLKMRSKFLLVETQVFLRLADGLTFPQEGQCVKSIVFYSYLKMSGIPTGCKQIRRMQASPPEVVSSTLDAPGVKTTVVNKCNYYLQHPSQL